MTSTYQEHASLVLPIEVWGTDVKGSIFRQSVSGRDFSADGALLDGLCHALNLGDLVGVQYKHTKAHAKITGIEEVEKHHNRQLSVQLLKNSPCPWQSALDPEAGASSVSVPERRRFTRHHVSVGIELRQEKSDVPLHLTTCDISAGGCYVETMLPMAAGTKLEIRMWPESGKLLTNGIVRTSYPGLGMGIEFVGITPAETQLLTTFLKTHAVIDEDASKQ